MRKLVILEGLNGSGKTTVFRLYRQATRFVPIILDRFIGSNIVFDKVYDRKNDEKDLFKIEKEICKVFDESYLIYLHGEYDKLISRIDNGKDTYKEAISKMKKTEKSYEYYLERTSIKNVLRIDTTEKPIVDVVNEILCFTNEKARKTKWKKYCR